MEQHFLAARKRPLDRLGPREPDELVADVDLDQPVDLLFAVGLRVDLDNVDIINAFIKGAAYRGITVLIRGDLALRTVKLINAPQTEVRFA